MSQNQDLDVLKQTHDGTSSVVLSEAQRDLLRLAISSSANQPPEPAREMIDTDATRHLTSSEHQAVLRGLESHEDVGGGTMLLPADQVQLLRREAEKGPAAGMVWSAPQEASEDFQKRAESARRMRLSGYVVRAAGGLLLAGATVSAGLLWWGARGSSESHAALGSEPAASAGDYTPSASPDTVATTPSTTIAINRPAQSVAAPETVPPATETSVPLTNQSDASTDTALEPTTSTVVSPTSIPETASPTEQPTTEKQTTSTTRTTTASTPAPATATSGSSTTRPPATSTSAATTASTSSSSSGSGSSSAPSTTRPLTSTSPAPTTSVTVQGETVLEVTLPPRPA